MLFYYDLKCENRQKLKNFKIHFGMKIAENYLN